MLKLEYIVFCTCGVILKSINISSLSQAFHSKDTQYLFLEILTDKSKPDKISPELQNLNQSNILALDSGLVQWQVYTVWLILHIQNLSLIFLWHDQHQGDD